VVTLPGVAPAIDDALADLSTNAVLDVSTAADLVTAGEHGVHAGDGAAVDHDHGDDLDPHFWLDPSRLAAVGDAVAEALARVAADDGDDFRSRAAALRGELEQLDADMARDLATCRDRTIVTSHTAFGYLAERYGFEQVGVLGLSSEGEPSAKDVADAVDRVRELGLATVYVEAGADRDVADAVAKEAGARVAELDPIEREPDGDYVSAMRSDLAALVAGQRCT
jgi:zinc transport system substrate-binding protein